MKNHTFISTIILGAYVARGEEPNMMTISAMANDLCSFIGEDPEAELLGKKPKKEREDLVPDTPPENSLLLFACKGRKFWGLTKEKLDKLKDLYGDRLDVLGECRRIAEWCENNPPRRKCYKSMDKWLSERLSYNHAKAKPVETKSVTEQVREMEQ